jgi:glycosyltransferase involved in cell wall biosynthesis
MTRKRILVTHLDALFPKVMASQDHAYKMVKRLAQDHIVDIATTVRNEQELIESRRHLEGICNTFYPIVPINPENDIFKRKLRGAQFWLNHLISHAPHHYFYAGRRTVMRQLQRIVEHNKYNIVQAEYWHMAQLFRYIDSNIFKAIDTHDVLFDKKRQEIHQQYGAQPPSSKRKEFEKYKQLEIEHLKLADLIIAVSSSDLKMFSDLNLGNHGILAKIGQDMEYFRERANIPKENTILFYGSMGGEHNIYSFFRFWKHIYPVIQNQIPDLRLLVVGSSPPDSIMRLDDGKNVIVTGYVEDVREYLPTAKVAVIPLDVAAGFRSRTIEVMAMGIPVVGTHKALDSIEMEHGRHGFISDNNTGMANYVIDLLRNDSLLINMSRECRKFVEREYSIDATYGNLSRHYLSL